MSKQVLCDNCKQSFQTDDFEREQDNLKEVLCEVCKEELRDERRLGIE